MELDLEDSPIAQLLMETLHRDASLSESTLQLVVDHRSAVLQLIAAVDAVAAKLVEGEQAKALTMHHSAAGSTDAGALSLRITAGARRLGAEVEKVRKEAAKARAGAERIWAETERLDEEVEKRIEETNEAAEESERLEARVERTRRIFERIRTGCEITEKEFEDDSARADRQMSQLILAIEEVDGKREKLEAEISSSMGEMQRLRVEAERLMVEVKWPWAGTGCQEVARD